MQLTIHKQFHFQGHKGAVYALARQNDSSFFSAGSEGLIATWNVNGSSDALATAKVKGQIFSLCYLEEKQHILGGTMDGILYVNDIKEHEVIRAINTQCDSIFDIAYIKSLGLLAVATKLGILNFFNAEYELKHRVDICDNSLRSIAVLPEHNFIAIAASDHNIYIYNTLQHKIQQVLDAPQHSVFSVAFSPNGQYLLAGSRDACLYIFEVEKEFSLLLKIPAHLFTINQILFHPEGKIFFTAGRDKHIKLWDAETFELLKVIDYDKYEGHLNSVNKLLWMNTSSLLISAGDDKAIMGWKIEL
jgi:WD40 repeat protein